MEFLGAKDSDFGRQAFDLNVLIVVHRQNVVCLHEKTVFTQFEWLQIVLALHLEETLTKGPLDEGT